MKLSEWRPAITGWFSEQITVDSWVLATPDQVGDVTGFIPPLRDVLYEGTSPTEVEAQATQDIHILKTYSAELTYQQLPVAALEGLYQTVAIRLQHDWRDIHADLSGLEFLKVPMPVAIREMADERSEWVVELHWTFRINYMATPEVGSVQPPFDVKRLITGLHRSDLTSETFRPNEVLDTTLDHLFDP